MIHLLRLDTTGELSIERTGPMGTLGTLQGIVGGHLDCVRLNSQIDMWVHDEGMIDADVQPNFPATFMLHLFNEAHHRAMTIIYGDVAFSTHDGDGNTVSCPVPFINRVSALFRVDVPE